MRRLRIAFVVAVCLPWGAGSGLASGERIGEGAPQTPHKVTAPSGATNLPFLTGITDASSFDRAMDARLAHAQRAARAARRLQGRAHDRQHAAPLRRHPARSWTRSARRRS